MPSSHWIFLLCDIYAHNVMKKRYIHSFNLCVSPKTQSQGQTFEEMLSNQPNNGGLFRVEDLFQQIKILQTSTSIAGQNLPKKSGGHSIVIFIRGLWESPETEDGCWLYPLQQLLRLDSSLVHSLTLNFVFWSRQTGSSCVWASWTSNYVCLIGVVSNLDVLSASTVLFFGGKVIPPKVCSSSTHYAALDRMSAQIDKRGHIRANHLVLLNT